MTEQKEFESLDELFRKTFDNLPETPAPSGWDTPSEKVWQHVQKQIKPPKSGWSTQTLTLIAAFAVTITVGLYFLLNRPAQPETPAAVPPPATAETTELPADDRQEQVARIEAQPASPETTQLLPAKTAKKKTAAAKKTVPYNSSVESEAAKPAQADSSFEKPAEQERKVPNSTLRRKAELAKRAKEAWETPLDPLPLHWPGDPNSY
ncbi:MAG TPA: hypothetical protein PK228_11680 [Saprospiraceae bacterium]|nr:hypothetical protein [Saprospiraceae bacterium]